MKTKFKVMPGFERISHSVLMFWSLFCLIPFLLLIIASLSSEASITQIGYSFFPKDFSFGAYDYLFKHSSQIVSAYGITLLVTVVGTASSLLLTSTFAYTLSRPNTPFRRIVNFMVFFTMLFNGGLVPSYLMWTEIFHIKNTIWALIIPGLLMNGFYVLIMRNYFTNTIHPAIIEAAKIDGSGELRTFFQVVLPISLPILATVGLFCGLAYWNDWQNGLYYVTDSKLFSIQFLLNKMIQDVQFLSTGNFGDQAKEQLSKLPNTTIRMSIAVIGVLPILVIYPIFQKYFAKGIAIGAVKG
jgi:putative aldouronate transport system permease protein